VALLYRSPVLLVHILLNLVLKLKKIVLVAMQACTVEEMVSWNLLVLAAQVIIVRVVCPWPVLVTISAPPVFIVLRVQLPPSLAMRVITPTPLVKVIIARA
jgi:hypothetical protein